MSLTVLRLAEGSFAYLGQCWVEIARAIAYRIAGVPSQENRQVTLPVGFRRCHNMKKGDAVVFKETVDGLLISPKEALVMKLMDEIDEGLKARGITLDELIASGWEIRQEIYDEKYATETDD